MTTINESIVDISVGGTFGAAIDSKKNVWTWGNNASGERGLGDYQNRNLIQRVNLLKGKFVSSISCGTSHILVLGADIITHFSPKTKRKFTLNSEKRPKEISTTPRNASAPKFIDTAFTPTDSKRRSPRRKSPRKSEIPYKEDTFSPKKNETENFIVDSVPYPIKKFDKPTKIIENKGPETSERAY